MPIYSFDDLKIHLSKQNPGDPVCNSDLIDFILLIEDRLESLEEGMCEIVNE